jgi:hypothetical protein
LVSQLLVVWLSDLLWNTVCYLGEDTLVTSARLTRSR